MTAKKGVVEQRQYARFQVPGLSAYAVVKVKWPRSPMMGGIVDIGGGGLSFYYAASEKHSIMSSELDILLTDGSFYLNRVPFKTISDVELDSDTPVGFSSRRCGVKFGDLTDDQRSNLMYFIRSYTTADPEA